MTDVSHSLRTCELFDVCDVLVPMCIPDAFYIRNLGVCGGTSQTNIYLYVRSWVRSRAKTTSAFTGKLGSNVLEMRFLSWVKLSAALAGGEWRWEERYLDKGWSPVQEAPPLVSLFFFLIPERFFPSHHVFLRTLLSKVQLPEPPGCFAWSLS